MCNTHEIPDGKRSSLSYITISSLMERFLEDYEKSADTTRKQFDNRQRVFQFFDFREQFYDKLPEKDKKYNNDSGVPVIMNALVAWTQIYSFIKGSIEAAFNYRALTRDEYTDMEVMSRKRCRLDMEGRHFAYTIFEKYERFKETHFPGRRDEPDLVLEVFNRLQRFFSTGREIPRFSRVYIDEVQDLTQAEIAVLVQATMKNKDALFFAGGKVALTKCQQSSLPCLHHH